LNSLARKQYASDEQDHYEESRIDRASVLEGTDIVAIARDLGLHVSNQRSGKRVGMLCPMHNDKHFGSCYLDTEKQRFYCYVCHKGGNSVDLVMAANGWDSNDGSKAIDAMKLIANMYGRNVSQVSRVERIAKDRIRIPKKEEMDELGISNEPAYSIAGYAWDSEIQARMEKKEPYRIIYSDQDDDMVAFQVDKNPLQRLADTDPDEFKHLIQRKALEKRAEYMSIKNLLTAPNRQYTADELAVCKEVVQNGLLEMVLMDIENRIYNVQRIMCEYAS